MFPAASRAQLTLLCLSATTLALTGVLADLPPGTRRNNAYLPPDKPGYDYKPPGQGFPSPGPPARPPGPPTGPPARPPGPPARPPGPPTGPPGGGYPAPGPRPTPGFPGGQNPGPGEEGHVHMPGMPFDFNYAVKEEAYGNDYSHNAISDGDVTRGEYRVQLPDGRTQIVRYTADWKNGFMAQVSYEGTPRFGNGPAGPGGPQGPGGGIGGGGGGPPGGYTY